MDWFMRSDLALELGITLYVVFEILAVPVVSLLTVHKKISSIVRETIFFSSFVLALAAPIVIATTSDSQLLQLNDDEFNVYLTIVMASLTMVSFLITLTVDLVALIRLRKSRGSMHDQIRFFKKGSGIAYLVQAMWLLCGIFTYPMFLSIYKGTEFYKENTQVGFVVFLISLVLFPFVLISGW